VLFFLSKISVLFFADMPKRKLLKTSDILEQLDLSGEDDDDLPDIEIDERSEEDDEAAIEEEVVTPMVSFIWFDLNMHYS
jgi:hypothetical protein